MARRADGFRALVVCLCFRPQVIYLLRELWRGRSAKEGEPPAVPGKEWGLKRATSHLCLTRWDARLPAHVDNLVSSRRERKDCGAGVAPRGCTARTMFATLASPTRVAQVLLTHEEADAHDAMPDLEAVRRADPAFHERVERVLRKARNEHFF